MYDQLTVLLSLFGLFGCACARVQDQAQAQAKPCRAAWEHEFSVGAPAEKVWPLLCPVRETDWIPGWKAEVLWSESGVAENNCIFRTAHGGRALTWVISRYEPGDGILEFVVTTDDLVMKLDIRLEDHGDGTSALYWRRTMTGITPAGSGYVRTHFTREQFIRDMELLARRLDHYCRTGHMWDEGRH